MADTGFNVDDQITVLIVDDTELIRRLVSQMLDACGNYRIVEASSGIEALRRAKYHRVDVVLLDVMMPEMDGLEVCRRFRLDPFTASIPVVLVTALADEDSRRKGFEAGANDYINKPLNRTGLMKTLHKVLTLG
jgi:CheY-like chemotaxis protein